MNNELIVSDLIEESEKPEEFDDLIPLTLFLDCSNPYPFCSLNVIAKLFIDNCPDWELNVIEWMKKASKQGALDSSTLQYNSLLLGERSSKN